MGTRVVQFCRTEWLVPPLEPEEHDLSRGKGPRGPGGCYSMKKIGKSDLNDKFAISTGDNWGAIWSYRGLSTTVGTARA